MAQRVVTTLIDDLDGESEGAETVYFGLDGQQYEIDLTEAHAGILRDIVSDFVSAARRAGAPRSGGPARAARRSRSAVKETGPNLSAVRAWAKEQGMAVSDRGRVSDKVLDAYQAAH